MSPIIVTSFILTVFVALVLSIVQFEKNDLMPEKMQTKASDELSNANRAPNYQQNQCVQNTNRTNNFVDLSGGSWGI